MDTKFELTPEQVVKLKEWDVKYPTDHIDVSGANHIFEFIPSGLGLHVIVKKISNGELIEINLSEYEYW